LRLQRKTAREVPVRREFKLIIGAAALALAACSEHATAPVPTRVDELLASCPSASDVASINRDLVLTFTSDPTATQPLSCTAGRGSANLTVFQERVYQALLAIRIIPFDAPLPWTSKPLYTWLVAAIGGISFDSIQGGSSYCCAPARVIHINATSNSCALGGTTTRWIASEMPCGLDALIAVIVHEARHSEGHPHTCGSNDNTIDELGAWGVVYYLFRWFGEHTGTFLTPSDGLPSAGFYRATAEAQAQQTCSSRFCLVGCPAAVAHQNDLSSSRTAVARPACRS
jgi:hypothetical protein